MKRVLVTPLAALSLAVPAALAWPGPPKAPPPPPPQPNGAPPPAWIETQTKSAWLFWGSYCWKTACVDMIPPQTRPGLPVFTANRATTIRVHLGFAAKQASITINGHAVRANLAATKRIISWPAGRAGILTVSTRAIAGDASYVARLRVG
jgi:hypothetical protein